MLGTQGSEQRTWPRPGPHPFLHATLVHFLNGPAAQVSLRQTGRCPQQGYTTCPFKLRHSLCVSRDGEANILYVLFTETCTPLSGQSWESEPTGNAHQLEALAPGPLQSRAGAPGTAQRPHRPLVCIFSCLIFQTKQLLGRHAQVLKRRQ